MGSDNRSAVSLKRMHVVAAALLALSGAQAIVYAGLLPLAPFSDVPVPIVWQLFGIASLLAAVGVYLGRTWGRWLGVVVVVITLALDGLPTAADVTASGSAIPLLVLAVGVAIQVVILWVLLRRWAIEQ